MKTFVPLRDEFGAEFTRLDGRGYYKDAWTCPGLNCGTTHARFRCEECGCDALFCASCLVARHLDQPLHYIQVCTSSHLCSCTCLT
jgi:hypothetical protein